MYHYEIKFKDDYTTYHYQSGYTHKNNSRDREELTKELELITGNVVDRIGLLQHISEAITVRNSEGVTL